MCIYIFFQCIFVIFISVSSVCQKYILLCLFDISTTILLYLPLNPPPPNPFRTSVKDVCSQEFSPLGFLTWETTSVLWRAGWPFRMTTAQCCTASSICTPSPSLRNQSYYRTTSWTWQPACWPVALTPHAPSFSSSLWSVTHISLYNTAALRDTITR